MDFFENLFDEIAAEIENPSSDPDPNYNPLTDSAYSPQAHELARRLMAQLGFDIAKPHTED